MNIVKIIYYTISYSIGGYEIGLVLVTCQFYFATLSFRDSNKKTASKNAGMEQNNWLYESGSKSTSQFLQRLVNLGLNASEYKLNGSHRITIILCTTSPNVMTSQNKVTCTPISQILVKELLSQRKLSVNIPVSDFYT